MARRNSQDHYQAASLIWEQMRDRVPAPKPDDTPKPSKDPHVVLRRRGGQVVRTSTKGAWN